VSKAIDKKFGAEREVLGLKEGDRYKYKFSDKAGRSGGILGKGKSHDNRWITAPATPEAKEWDGFGSALKPCHEMTSAKRCSKSRPNIVNLGECWPNLAKLSQPRPI